MITNSNQSLLDIALQQDGNIESLLSLARQNNLPLDHSFSDAQPILAQQSPNVKKLMNGNSFATGIDKADTSWVLDDGFWNDANRWNDNETFND